MGPYYIIGGNGNVVFFIEKCLDTLPDSVEIIDLRNYNTKMKYIDNTDGKDAIRKCNNFANKFEEVLLTGYIPHFLLGYWRILIHMFNMLHEIDSWFHKLIVFGISLRKIAINS